MAMTSDPVGRIRTRKERYSTTCPAYSVRLNGGFKIRGCDLLPNSQAVQLAGADVDGATVLSHWS